MHLEGVAAGHGIQCRWPAPRLREGVGEFNVRLVPSERDTVVDCLADLLLRPQVQNSGGYVLVTKKHLDLLDIASRLAAEFSRGPPLMPTSA